MRTDPHGGLPGSDSQTLQPGTGRRPRQQRRFATRPPHGMAVALAILILAALSGAAVVAGVVRAAPQPASGASKPEPARSAPQAAAKTPEIQELKTRLDLKEPFNLAQGKVRIVVFFSPTCSHCIANANGLQQLVLDKLTTPDIEVFAVWMKILDTDNRQAVDRATTVLHDERVHHYWDTKAVLNAQLLDAIMYDFQIRLYNIELLYDRSAAWDKRLPRPPYWMHEYRGLPGPPWDAATFANEVLKALENKPLSPVTPR